MNALDNGIPASTVGLIYTFQLFSAPCTSFREKKVLLFCLNTSLKALKQEKKDNSNSNTSNKDLPHLLLSLRKRMEFSIRDFSNICDQIRSFLRIWSHLLEKSSVENFIICALMTHYFQALNS